MQFALTALSFLGRWNLSKWHHSYHFLEVKPVQANWASAGLWLVYLAGRGKTEASCQLLFAQAARFPCACHHGHPMEGLCAKQLLCFLPDYHLGWEERLPHPATCSPSSPQHHHHGTASTWKGSFRQQRAAALWREQGRRRDSSWSQRKGSRRWNLCLCCAVYSGTQPILHLWASHTPPLLTLCCDHIAALGDKKAFSSVTELSYYLKCYLNTTIKYSCESISDCRS